MRLGVVADVHGNVHALEAAMRAVGDVDAWICPGDVVGYGPRPNECAARVRSLDPLVTVAGNHDLMVVDRMPEYDLGPLPKRTLDWTRGVLSGETRDWLSRLPLTAGGVAGGAVFVAHGSLDDATTYVRSEALAREQLRLLGEREPDARVLLLGHTHVPMAFSAERGLVRPRGEIELRAGDGPWLLNPGAVGQSRERRALARALVLDTERGIARFVAVRYDTRATRRELLEAGLPPHAHHLAPGRLARWRRRRGARRHAPSTGR